MGLLPILTGAISRGLTCSQESGYTAVNLNNLKSGSGRSLFSITRAYRTRVEPSPLRQVKPKKRFIGESKIGGFEKALLSASKEDWYDTKRSVWFCQTIFRIVWQPIIAPALGISMTSLSAKRGLMAGIGLQRCKITRLNK
jgi:hypothetical protein